MCGLWEIGPIFLQMTEESALICDHIYSPVGMNQIRPAAALLEGRGNECLASWVSLAVATVPAHTAEQGQAKNEHLNILQNDETHLMQHKPSSTANYFKWTLNF